MYSQPFLHTCIRQLTSTSDSEPKDLPLQALVELRAIYRNAQELSQKLRDFSSDLSGRERTFSCNLRWFKGCIDAAAMRFGLTHLPDEILCDILLRVVWDLKSTVKLSHVCRRFRSTVLSHRAFWNVLRLRSTWTPEQALTFAERCDFRQLKVTIAPPDRDSPVLTETVKTIFEFHEHIGDLHIISTSASQIEEIQRHLGHRGMPKLWRLHLEVIRGAGTTFEGFCEMPSLGSLRSDLLPHVSLARALFRCTLTLTKPHVPDLLQFLASTSFLEELFLQISGDESFEANPESCEPVSLECLRVMTVRVLAPCRVLYVIMENLRTPAVYKFTLSLTYPIVDDTVFELVESRPSIRELVVEMYNGCWCKRSLDFGLIPPPIVSLTLSGSWQGKASLANPESFRARRLKWLKFERLSFVSEDTVLSCRDVFIQAGHGDVHVQLKNCTEYGDIQHTFIDEVYKLNEVDSAFTKRRNRY